MLAESNLLQDMQCYAFSPGPAGRPLCVYGDPPYPLRLHLQTPFRNMILAPQMVNFNKAMSSVRVVEWLFGDIVEYFKSVDFKRKPQDWTFFNRKHVHRLRLIKKCIKILIWQHNL